VTGVETSGLLLEEIQFLKVHSRRLLIKTTRRLHLICQGNNWQWFKVRHEAMGRVIVLMMLMTMIGRTVGHKNHTAVIHGKMNGLCDIVGVSLNQWLDARRYQWLLRMEIMIVLIRNLGSNYSIRRREQLVMSREG
jgi:hypothetical protein